MVDVAARFEEVRAVRGWSKAEVARRAGIPPESLNSILRKNNPRLNVVYNISKGLGVSVVFLMGEGEGLKEALETIPEDFDQKRPNVAARIKMLVRITGKSKTEVSKKIKVLPTWWTPIMNSNNPTAETIVRIARGFEISPQYLVKPVSAEEYGQIMMPGHRVAAGEAAAKQVGE